MIKTKILGLFYGIFLFINLKSLQQILFDKLITINDFEHTYALKIARKLKQQHKFIHNCNKSTKINSTQKAYIKAIAFRTMKKYDEAFECLEKVPDDIEEILIIKIKNLYDLRKVDDIISISSKYPIHTILEESQKDFIITYAYNNLGMIKAKKLIDILVIEDKERYFINVINKLLNSQKSNRDFIDLKNMVNNRMLDITDRNVFDFTMDVCNRLSIKLKGNYRFDAFYLNILVENNLVNECEKYISSLDKEKQLNCLLYLANVFFNTRNLKYSLYFSEKAYDLCPNDTNVIRSLIRAHHGLGNLTERVYYVEKLKKIDESKLIKDELEMAKDELDLYYKKSWSWNKKITEINKNENIILHVLNKSLPEINGYTIRSSEIINHQVKKGFKPVVVTKLGWTPEKNQESDILEKEINGVKHYHIIDQDTNLELNKSPLTDYFNKYAEYFSKIIELVRPSIVHAASNFQNALAPLLVAKKYNIPTIYEVRGMWHYTQSSKIKGFENSERYKLQESLEIKCCEIADKVVCISESLKGDLLNKGIPEEKIKVVPNGVDTNKFEPKKPSLELINKYNLKGKLVIGFIGSITEYEGLEYILYAVKKIIDKNISNIKFLVVGDGPELLNLKKIVKKLRIENYVAFVGKVPHEKVSEYYSVIDVFPFPRINEKVCNLVTPLKPYEAMAMGKLVAVSNIPALQEMVIHEETGVVFETENVDSIVKVLENATKYRSLGYNGLQWVVLNRSWGNLVNIYENIYESITIKNLVEV